jgi:uncharacterized protein
MTQARSKPQRAYTVRKSDTHGRGAFAARSIRKGARIIEYVGARSSWDVASLRPLSDPDDPYHTFLFELDDGTVIDAGIRGNAARWINHSCDPNCEPIEYEGGRVFIHAKRAISAGEELNYDYRLTLPGKISKRALKALACRCGARRCRGTMLLLPRKPKRAPER